MKRRLADSTMESLEREVKQLLLNYIHAERGDDPTCPDCDYIEKVRIGAWHIHGMIEHDESHNPADYIGSDARWRYHLQPILEDLRQLYRNVSGMTDGDDLPDGVLGDLGDAIRGLEDALAEGGEDDLCTTGADDY